MSASEEVGPSDTLGRCLIRYARTIDPAGSRYGTISEDFMAGALTAVRIALQDVPPGDINPRVAAMLLELEAFANVTVEKYRKLAAAAREVQAGPMILTPRDRDGS